MALLHSLSRFFCFLIFSSASASASADIPKFAFSWFNDTHTFGAGDIATISIKVLGNFDHPNRNAFNPTLTVNGKPGNSCYVSGVSLHLGHDLASWTIFFIPISTGRFNVVILDHLFQVYDSSLQFDVVPGTMYPSFCVASWMSEVNEFEAGSNATVVIVPSDAFGNQISATNQHLLSHHFTLSISEVNASVAYQSNVTHLAWTASGYFGIELMVAKAGRHQLLYVQLGNQHLKGSPLAFKVNPAALEVSNCAPEWTAATNAWQLFSVMEVLIHQHDHYGNLVPGLYAFDAQVVDKDTNLSLPVTDLHFEESEPGIQFLSFTISEPGNFFLTISDMNHDKTISHMPYAYKVFVGYCDGVKSVVKGSGLNNSVAGEMVELSVYLNDLYEYPAPVDVETMHVEVKLEHESYFVLPRIRPMPILNGSGVVQETSNGAPNLISEGSFKVEASAFSVSYTPEKSGMYTIRLLCGNIILNGGRPFRKQVRAGEVNVSLSGVVKYDRKVSRMIKNEIVVQLRDSFSNLVLSQQSKLKLEIASLNASAFKTWMFEDHNGSYTSHYMAHDIGTYEMCVSFDAHRFSPCPFALTVYTSEYFPKAYDDVISVWEEESVGFDALANDYFAAHTATIVEYSQPGHGSLLHYHPLLRYTPYKHFYGNDSFTYTICDANGNLATASVNISVLTIPPQFVSFPTELQATEDVVTPTFGGFSGFEIQYSDPAEIVSVTISAQSGNILLSPMLMQFWQPSWSQLSVTKMGDGLEYVIMEGSVDVINFALQSIQYLGNDNFYGKVTIQVSTKNMNGINKIDVPVYVEPVNDPPLIYAPEFILLKSNEGESLIFDKDEDKFEFCIRDADLVHFPGDKNDFKVAFSVEVNSGFLVATLPAELINTTELKFKNSDRWQPLETYVSISKHFTVEAKGIRFEGKVNECNSVMQKLLYHVSEGGEQGAVLTVRVSDMGEYGCYPDCYGAQGMSVPTYAEATLNLIPTKPMTLFVAQSLGSAVVVESIMVFSLGVLLVLFTCKCVLLLVRERKMKMSQQSTVNTTIEKDEDV